MKEKENKMVFSYNICKSIVNELGRFTVADYSHFGLVVILTHTVEYAVGTDEECQDAWDTQLENYIDDCVLGEIPAEYQSYFDRDKFARDCSYAGRGHSLASYDGNEIELGNGIFAYRLN